MTRPKLLKGDAVEVLKGLKDENVQCVVTSPPYWGLRDYGSEGQLGLEETPEEYVENMVSVFQEVKRVLRKDGTVWMNLGDTYGKQVGKGFNTHEEDGSGNRVTEMQEKHGDIKVKTGLPSKNLVGIPWRVALALQADGWILRSDIIWHKPNPMPESVKDRPTKSHEYIFLLTKSQKYYYDHEAIKEKGSGRIPGNKVPQKGAGMVGFEIRDGLFKIQGEPQNSRNKRSVWKITTKPYKEAHFATFPEEIPETCIKAGTKRGDVVLDPFVGSGTVCAVASRLGRDSIGIDLSEEYLKLARKRCKTDSESLLKYV